MCLAQGHNAVTPVRLEPAAPWSRVKHSTTESLRFLLVYCKNMLKLMGKKTKAISCSILVNLNL